MWLKDLVQALTHHKWTVKVIPHTPSTVSSFKIRPIHLWVTSLLFLFSTASLLLYAHYRKGQEAREIVALKKMVERRERQLQDLYHQKEEIKEVLATESEKVEGHIKALQRDEQEIRKLLGLKKKTSAAPLPVVRQVALRHQPNVLLLYRFGKKSSRGNASFDQIRQHLLKLKREALATRESLEEIKVVAKKYRKKLDAEERRLQAIFERIPSALPVDGYISSGFGYRVHPISGITHLHNGVDVTAPYGTPIQAAAAGIVITCEWAGGFGNTIKIDHENGYVSQYSHCSQLLVSYGERVRKGQIIGLVGSTGYATGPHLHYTLFYEGSLMDPQRLIGVTPKQLAQRKVSFH